MDRHSNRFLDEATLVSELRLGSDDAFEYLIRSLGPRLLNTARRFLRSEEDARDAFQESMITTIAAIHQFNGESKLSSWLHKIVVNRCLMRLRTDRRRAEESIENYLPHFLEDGHQSESNTAWTESADLAFEKRELSALVQKLIHQIPEPYRTTLLLRDLEEWSTAECATLLEISENAVKIRLHRARQALRTLLDPFMRSKAAGRSQQDPSARSTAARNLW